MKEIRFPLILGLSLLVASPALGGWEGTYEPSVTAVKAMIDYKCADLILGWSGNITNSKGPFLVPIGTYPELGQVIARTLPSDPKFDVLRNIIPVAPFQAKENASLLVKYAARRLQHFIEKYSDRFLIASFPPQARIHGNAFGASMYTSVPGAPTFQLVSQEEMQRMRAWLLSTRIPRRAPIPIREPVWGTFLLVLAPAQSVPDYATRFTTAFLTNASRAVTSDFLFQWAAASYNWLYFPPPRPRDPDQQELHDAMTELAKVHENRSWTSDGISLGMSSDFARFWSRAFEIELQAYVRSEEGKDLPRLRALRDAGFRDLLQDTPSAIIKAVLLPDATEVNWLVRLEKYFISMRLLINPNDSELAELF